jgi:hypothetical protein
MAINEENIRLLFGIKLKQLRTENSLSLAELAKLSGISVSYLNEIEKGKKYPKREKIIKLAESLHTSYDHMVSLQLDQKLAPIADLLNSNFLHELPLEMFGLEPANIIDLLSTAPSKLSAFVSTLIEMGRNYDMQVETFYYSVLRSYQEIHENYFSDIEKKADEFRNSFGLQDKRISSEDLRKILVENYHYQIDERYLPKIESLQSIRSFYDQRLHILYLNGGLKKQQLAFLFGREIAFRFLSLEPRTFTASPLEINSFEEVLNNFYASYFSSALIIPKKVIVDILNPIFKSKNTGPEKLKELLSHFNGTEEMLLQRMTNILPKHFGLKNIFFLKFNYGLTSKKFSLVKELHLAGLHNPHALATNEHYCRRWISLSILKDLEKQLQHNGQTESLAAMQRSNYYNSENEYLILSLARSSYPTPDTLDSLSIGILLNEPSKRKLKFWNNEAIPTKVVNETCERCPIDNCQERAAPPLYFQRKQQQQEIKEAIQELIWNSTD